MKKIWILLVSLAITAILLFIWLQDKPTGSKVQDLDESNKLAKSTSSTELETSTSQKQVDDSILLENEDLEETKEQYPYTSNVCKEQLAEQYPELQRQFIKTMQEFYFSEEEHAGQDVYREMDFQTLKSLADSNDSKAMISYGTEIIWFSAIGVRLSQESNSYRSNKELQQIVDNHKIDIEGIKEGEHYLYKAAVFGKVGAIFELIFQLDMAARRLDTNSGERKTINEFITKTKAYEKLLIDIHQSDPGLRGLFLESVRMNNTIQRLYADREDYTEIKKQIETDAEILYQDLKQRWEHDREYYGFDIYPDYLQGELEEYGNAYLECHLR